MNKIKYLVTTLLITFVFFSCNEDEWLKEEALDFYSPENSFTTTDQFNSAVARLYESTNDYIMWSAHMGNYVYQYTSDIAYDAIDPTHDLNSYADKITPETSQIRQFWDRYYRVIFDANVILGRIDNEEVEVPEAEKTIFKAEASFFRAYMYRNLGIQFGGVPLVLEEFTEPKRDFQRASRDAVYQQCITDLVYAAANLPGVTELKEEGRVTKAAANHLLAELYIITGDYDKAIAASSSVINDPNYSLMTTRFGTRSDEPGDPYWDLFRRGNQNRNGGMNTESIWVAQYEYLVDGGGRGSNLCRFLIPLYWQLTGDSDGVSLFFGHSSKYGGRGIGWMAPSDYMLNQIWEDDPDDMRNSENNIIRDIVADNPESAYFGQKIVESGAIANYPDPYKRNWSAIIAKAAPINNFPAEVIADPETGATLNGANMTFRDHYYMRLAETYLLRAEAYLNKDDLIKAAEDINTVRARANADPVAPGDVNIDYILDERARELHFEEPRIITLMRLGKLVERVRKYDPMHNGDMVSNGIMDYHNLWPIPQTAIERNTEATLEQNPGYF